MAGVDALGESVTKSKWPDRQVENLGNEGFKSKGCGLGFRDMARFSLLGVFGDRRQPKLRAGTRWLVTQTLP